MVLNVRKVSISKWYAANMLEWSKSPEEAIDRAVSGTSPFDMKRKGAVGVLKKHPWITIQRPAVCILMVFGTLVGGLLVTVPRGNQVDWVRMIIAMIGSWAVAMSTQVTNDVADRKIDAIEKPNRPIPSGLITARQALVAGIAGYVLAIVCGFLVSIALGLMYTGIVIISIHYNYNGKGLPLIGNFEVAVAVASIPVWGAASQGCPWDLWFLWCFICTFETGRELAVTIQDVEADGGHGLKTLPVLIGRTPSGIVVLLFYCASLPFIYFSKDVPGFGPLFWFGSVALVASLIGTFMKVSSGGWQFRDFEIWIRTRGRFFILLYQILLLIEVFF